MFKNNICCMGDSLTNEYTRGVPLHLHYPTILTNNLIALGAMVNGRNFGRAGNTSQDMINRFDLMTMFCTPNIGIIFGGVNDPSAPISQSQTQANLQTMVTTLKNVGCNNIMIVSAQFLNYTTGGDFDGSDIPKDETTCNYASVIAAQKAAATATGAIYVDLFNYLRNRIINGQDTKHSASWHVQNTNQHFNAYGQGLVASCVQSYIPQSWIDELKS